MFLETICIQNGIVYNLQRHVARMQETAAHFGFVVPRLPELETLMPKEFSDERVKCRIIYHAKIDEITFEKYIPKIVKSFKLVEASPNYSFKFSDRTELNSLLSQKGDYDEILIARNGCITDTSFSNVVFRRGNDFFTPDTYVLNGTKRQLLLREGIIREKRITVENMNEFEEIILINAMLPLNPLKGTWGRELIKY
ncbi:MAG: aminotransferase class IV [Dysgonamonadaceae bacterium]|jgi:4-amino-4-deoxychorismate lyase|nr:aminotransferase class IV [Dysgonamonadaceae bacterium]